MFVAGKMFATPQEAREWVEKQTSLDERRHWIVIELEGDEPSPPPPVQGLHIHKFVNDVCACGAKESDG